jgi:hypothetical protein
MLGRIIIIADPKTDYEPIKPKLLLTDRTPCKRATIPALSRTPIAIARGLIDHPKF